MLAQVVIPALSLVRVQQLGATVEELGHEQVERLQLALRWRSNIAVNATRVLSITQTDGDDLQGYFKGRDGSTTADTTKVQQHRELEKSPGGCAFRKNWPPCAKSYLETRDKALAMKKAGDVAQARGLCLEGVCPVVDRHNAVADKMVAYQIERSEAQAAEANALIRSYRMAVVVAGVAGLALLVVLSWVLVARIRQSLSEVSGVARRIRRRATCPALCR